MAKRTPIANVLKRSSAGYMDEFVASTVTLEDDSTISGELAFTGGYNPGVKLLVAGAANTVTAADSGKIIVFNVAAATLVTLPAPEVGMKFTFITSILATGDHEIQALTNAEGFVGGVTVVSTTAAKSDAFSAAAGGTDDFITQTGGTNGGGAGSIVTVVGILAASAAKCWLVSGNLLAVGSSTATPFAAS